MGPKGRLSWLFLCLLLVGCGAAPSPKGPLFGLKSWSAGPGADLLESPVSGGPNGAYVLRAVSMKTQAAAPTGSILITVSQGSRSAVLYARSVPVDHFTGPPLVFPVGSHQEDVVFPAFIAPGDWSGALYDVVQVTSGDRPSARLLGEFGLNQVLPDGTLFRQGNSLIVSAGLGLGYFTPEIVSFTSHGLISRPGPIFEPGPTDHVVAFTVVTTPAPDATTGQAVTLSVTGLPSSITLRVGQHLDLTEGTLPAYRTDISPDGKILSLLPTDQWGAVILIARAPGHATLTLLPGGACWCGGSGGKPFLVNVTVAP